MKVTFNSLTVMDGWLRRWDYQIMVFVLSKCFEVPKTIGNPSMRLVPRVVGLPIECNNFSTWHSFLLHECYRTMLLLMTLGANGCEVWKVLIDITIEVSFLEWGVDDVESKVRGWLGPDKVEYRALMNLKCGMGIELVVYIWMNYWWKDLIIQGMD